MTNETSTNAESWGPRVFISYSRLDLNEAERISDELTNRGHLVTRDLEDILPTEEWKVRLEKLIAEADAVVFLLSPQSASSEVCRWEVEFAQSLSKKIAPIVIKDIEGEAIPEMLSRLNYIFATSKSRFENALACLSDAISTDIEWIREHTRLTNIAIDFLENGEKKDQLLTQSELDSAHQWAERKPQSLSSIASGVLDLIDRSQEHLSLCNQYTSARLRALTEIVDPLLVREIEALKIQADELHSKWDGTIVKSDSKELELKERIKTLQNFRSSAGGRWHPQPAEWVQSAGAQADYTEVYKFPCCDTYTTLAVSGTPPQFRADGCENDPTV